MEIKSKIIDYFGKDPPWQYPTATELISISFWFLPRLFVFRYSLVFSMHDALDDVYFTIGYKYKTPAINKVQ